MTNTERHITEATTDELAAMHAEATEIMSNAVAARSRDGYQLARIVAETVEAELNARGLIAQEDEDFEVIGWVAA